MFTRKEYLAKECTHREFFGQFVNDSIRETVQTCIGLDKILASTDEAFNDIPLANWDRLNISIYIHQLYWNISGKPEATRIKAFLAGYSLSDKVCIAKEAARQIEVSARRG